MELTDDQKQTVRQWVEAGASLNEIQSRLRDELGVMITYMETRFLVDDLQLTLKEKDRPAGDSITAAPATTAPGGPPAAADTPATGGVSVAIDQITRPNALISGKATFSDGQKAEWQIDQMGRLALQPATAGYRPSEPDVLAFQRELQRLAESQGL